MFVIYYVTTLVSMCTSDNTLKLFGFLSLLHWPLKHIISISLDNTNYNMKWSHLTCLVTYLYNDSLILSIINSISYNQGHSVLALLYLFLTYTNRLIKSTTFKFSQFDTILPSYLRWQIFPFILNHLSSKNYIALRIGSKQYIIIGQNAGQRSKKGHKKFRISRSQNHPSQKKGHITT